MTQDDTLHSEGNAAPTVTLKQAASRTRSQEKQLRNDLRRRRRPHPGFRSDIQGLRAIAVLLVFVNHLTGHPRGGFIGVDVFFVISGYLITGVLLRRTQQTGQLSLAVFYQARARRILPAALAVLTASFVVAHLIFRGPRVAQSVGDIRWALGFAANIRFQRVGTDYFQQGAPPSLVQHYWSLAVEEQFYLVWPVVILVVLTVTRRVIANEQARLTLLMVVVMVASAASFVLALQQTMTTPTTAYFSTFDRAWELGVGAMVAITAVRFPAVLKRSTRWRGPVSLAGVVLIAGSAFLVTSSSGFPAPWAALPVLATAVVLAAPAGHCAWTVVLTNPISAYTGFVSFSLYLWHWPVIIALQALLPTQGTVYYVMAVGLSVGLTVFSYHFVESPFRDRGFRERVERRAQDSPSWRPYAALAVSITLVAATLGAYTLRPAPRRPHFAAPAGAARSSHGPPGDPTIAQPGRPLSTAITTALQATSFPKLTPSIAALGTGKTAAHRDWAGCNTTTKVQRSCTFKPGNGRVDAAKVAVVLGDSVAQSWLPGIRAAIVPQGWTVYGLARQQCAAAYIKQRDLVASDGFACDRLHEHYAALLRQLRPSLVIMSSAEDELDNLRDRQRGRAAVAEYTAGMQRTLKLASSHGTRVVVLAPLPIQKSLFTCVTATASPVNCVSSPEKQWFAQRAADKVVSARAGVRYVDTHLWFCSADYFCPAFIGHFPSTYDGYHVTSPYVQTLQKQLRAQLLGTH